MIFVFTNIILGLINFFSRIKRILAGYRVNFFITKFLNFKSDEKLSKSSNLILYISVIRPILTYAATVWFPLLNKKDILKINSLQLRILHHVISSYRTVSYECAHLLNDIPIFSDYINICRIKRELKTNGTDPDIIECTIKIEIEKMRNLYLNKVNDNFKSFFPTGVPKHYRTDFFTTQFITGHGQFNSYLHKLNISNVFVPTCICNNIDLQTPIHLLTQCPMFNTPFTTPSTYTHPKNTSIFKNTCKYIIHTLQNN